MAYPNLGPTTITTVMPPAVGPESTQLACPHCHASIQTKIENESTIKTHAIALVLFLFMCWPCVCVPYCMDSCKNRNHYCPNCGAFIGTYKS